jgi:hypothetical protein
MTAVAEEGIERLLGTLTERTIGQADSVRLSQVLSAPIPRGIKAYLHAEVLHRLRTGLDASPAFQRIDRSAPAADLIRSFLRSLSYGYAFPREEFLSLLQDAFHFVTNYLLRPQWTLESFLFEGRSAVRVEELAARFSYIVDYSYFADLVLRILRKRQLEEAGIEEVRSLIARIDDQIVRQHNPRELSRLTRPIYDFLLLEENVDNRPIPLAPILLFFQDKKLTYLRDYVEGVCRIREMHALTMDELRTLIEDLETAESAGTPAAPPVEEFPAETSPLLPSGSPPDAEEVTAAAPEEPAAQQPGPTGTSANAALSLTYAGLQESRRSSSLADLDVLVETSERKKVFLKKIFLRDEDYYGAVVKALNDIRTWEEASAYLTEFFETNRLDPFSEEVVEFTDIVQRRYQGAPREGE